MTLSRADFRFLDRLRVRWVEVDMQKIVFNGHYLMYADTAVAGYWRALALPYHETMAHLGGDFYVRKATVVYHASACYDDVLDIGVRTARIGKSSMVFDIGVFRAEQLLVEVELIYVFAEPATQTSLAVPQPLREVLEDFEAGKAMVDVRLGDWATLGGAAGAIRQQVFMQEQRIAARLDGDEADAGCVHAVAYNRFGVPLGTGRLLAHGSGVARIGRMAVVAGMRGSGIGGLVLEALMHAAREHGGREALVLAHVSAEAFYRRAGFVRRGSQFDDAGIAVVEMVRGL